MLSGLEIKRQIELGNIKIEPFNEKQLNPNSYNIKLGNHLKIYETTKYGPEYISQLVTEKLEPLWNEFNLQYGDLSSQELYDASYNGVRDDFIKELEDKRSLYTKEIVRQIALDPKKDNKVIDIEIPEEGFILMPGILYLGTTEEYTETYGFIPNIDGRSTTGRLGIEIHRTAGFGDNGFCGKWTLEITVTHPVIVYTGMEIGQLYYEVIDGDDSMKYHGKYQNQNDVEQARVDKG